MQNVSAIFRGNANQSIFVDKSMKRLTFLTSHLLLQRSTRNFSKVNESEREVSGEGLVIFETDKSGRFAVLPQTEHQQRAGKMADALFQLISGDLRVLKK